MLLLLILLDYLGHRPFSFTNARYLYLDEATHPQTQAKCYGCHLDTAPHGFSALLKSSYPTTRQ